LLDGITPKELAHSLNITLNTFKTHQKNLYRKLNVSNVRQLIAKYSGGSAKAGVSAEAVFRRWRTFQDNFGSAIKVASKIEHIQDHYKKTFTIAGKLSTEPTSYTGVTAEPEQATLEAMKKMASFSFSVLGDGNSHKVIITTTDTRTKGGDNHYRRVFTTNKHEISTVNVNLNELFQSPLYGTPVPFEQNNIELFQVQPHSTGSFNIKIWDIKFH